MITLLILMGVGLVVGLLGFFILNTNCSKIISVLMLAIGLSVFLFSTFGAVITAGYITGRESVLMEQEKAELAEKQEALINELGLTEEQLELLRK